MKSLVLYCKSRNNIQESESKQEADKSWSLDNRNVEFHINLWKTKNGVIRIKPSLIFDFGIKFNKDITELCLFLPFRIPSQKGVEDLGKCLSTNRDLLNAVFNEDMICQSATNHCFCEISNNNNLENRNETFYIYHLGEDNIKLEEYTENSVVKGSFLTISINGTPSSEQTIKDKKYYVRFRVYVEDINEIVRTEILSNDLLQAAFSRMDLFDIRLNEQREIPSKVDEKMKKQQFELCTFNKLHFFYIVDTHETINNGVDVRKDSRLLENEQWIDYEPQSNMVRLNYIAHHWKKTVSSGEHKFSHFNLFFSTIYPKLSFVRLLAYFSIIVLLGWLGSELTFSVKDLVFCDNKTNWIFNWICPIIVVALFLFLIIYILKTNTVVSGLKVRRKI